MARSPGHLAPAPPQGSALTISFTSTQQGGTAITQAQVDQVYHGSPTVEEDSIAEAATASVVAHLKHRSDVVRHRGRYALLNTDLTPQQAMVADLLDIRAALDAAGVDFILVRGNDERPVIAVDWESRKAVRDALVEAFRNEPF